jgi:hypothetical protein
MNQEELYRARSEVLVITFIGEKIARKWWDSKNTAFNNITPNQAWAIDYEKVYNYLMQFAGR